MSIPDLVAMLEACAQWSVDVEGFRTALTTLAAQTLWRVLVVGETEIVAEAVLRIVAEINARLPASADPELYD